jgi:hypothetical protein
MFIVVSTNALAGIVVALYEGDTDVKVTGD